MKLDGQTELGVAPEVFLCWWFGPWGRTAL
jgi:hypothetical protein